ncbi:MAG: hypothetical protein GY809_26530 [Planctomycetes bacterium]|nr:hypothetical protein [Planctomycetota bacterium]
MKKILRYLLGCRNKGVSLMLGALGFTLGLFVLFAAIRFSGDVLDLLYPEDRDADSRFIIIYKKVNLRHTLGFGSTAFSQDELALLEKQACVRDVGRIMTTNFAVAGAAYMGTDGGMQSELFFEAVDDRFLDTHPEDWHWQAGDAQIPGIIARDFLVLYNFGFASAKGLPQLTEETIGLLKAYVVCSGEDTQQSFTGKIVGFSDRFSTILVPMSFMTWANAQIGQKTPPPVSRVILEIEPGREDAVQAYLESQSYQTNQERLPVTQVARTLRIALMVVCVFGIVLVLVSLLSLVLIIQLLISHAKQELQLLHELGFEDGFLTRTYVTAIWPVIVVPFVLAGGGIGVLGLVLKPMFMKVGFTISLMPDWPVMVLFVGGFVACLTLFYGLIGRNIRGIN